MLNLIVAVIVDSAHQAREADIMNMAAKKDAARAAAWDCFSDMVDELDENGDGAISVDELKRGLMNSYDLAAYLTVMGIEEADLEMVFELLDVNGEGCVYHDDFTNQLYQMKTQELPIAICYIRHSVAQLHNELHDGLDKVSREILEKLHELVGPKIAVDVAEKLKEVAVTTPQMTQACGKRKGLCLSPDQSGDTMEGKSPKGRSSFFAGSKSPPTLRHNNGPSVGKTTKVVRSEEREKEVENDAHTSHLAPRTSHLAPTIGHPHGAHTSHLAPAVPSSHNSHLAPSVPSSHTSHLAPSVPSSHTSHLAPSVTSYHTSHLPPPVSSLTTSAAPKGADEQLAGSQNIRAKPKNRQSLLSGISNTALKPAQRKMMAKLDSREKIEPTKKTYGISEEGEDEDDDSFSQVVSTTSKTGSVDNAGHATESGTNLVSTTCLSFSDLPGASMAADYSTGSAASNVLS